MVTMFNPKPQLFRSVEKPANVSTQEIANARPVYIDGIGTGGATEIADVTGLQAILTDLENRIAALESPAG